MIYHLSSQSAISRQKFTGEPDQVLKPGDILRLAADGDAHPSMTEIHGFETEYWDGTYLTNDGQIVVTEDALSLAIALEKSLDDIPDFNLHYYELDLEQDHTL